MRDPIKICTECFGAQYVGHVCVPTPPEYKRCGCLRVLRTESIDRFERWRVIYRVTVSCKHSRTRSSADG